MIYEYATLEDQAIYPTQLAPRSNKFRRDEFGRGPPLTVTQLSQTCRQIYGELNTYPVFYRVNTFAFPHHPMVMLNFLAALTPKRRHMIRHVSVDGMSEGWKKKPGWEYTDFGTDLSGSRILRHIFTLLRDCRDLRQIDFACCPKLYPQQKLNSIISHSQSTHPTNEVSLWSFPKARFEITILVTSYDFPNAYDDPFNRTRNPDFTMNLSGDIFTQVAPAYTFPGSVDLDLLRRANDAFVKYQTQQRELRKQIEETEKIYPTEQEIHDAVMAADLDFSGETRIDQRRSVGLRDTISHRTRAQLKDESNVTAIGTIVRQTPKYDVNGMFLWQYNIETIRWNGLAIECKVWFDGPNHTRVSSWEEIYHFGTYNHLRRILSFYKRMYRLNINNHSKGLETARTELEQIKSTPTQEEIAESLEGMMDKEPPSHWDKDWAEWTRFRIPKIKQLEERIKFLVQQEAEAQARAQAEAEAQPKNKAFGKRRAGKGSNTG